MLREICAYLWYFVALRFFANMICLQAHEHHRKAIEASDSISYPLDPTGQPGEVEFSQSVTDKPLEQR